MRSSRGAELAKLIVVGSIVVVPYIFPHFLLIVPLQYSVVKKFLSQTTPVEFISIKYVSALSMALFMVNIPGVLFVRDADFLIHLNCGVLLLTSVCMFTTMISTRPAAPL